MNAWQLPYLRPAALAGRHFSTVIVGAGINGVGVFRDLSLQRVDCLLVDKGDFGAGASSAPSRMIHGGLRYLENGGFSLVAEATRERNLLLRNAPHLVRPLETVVPLSSLFGGLVSSALRFIGRNPPQKRTRGLLAVALGLRLYDMLGRRQRALPAHRIERLRGGDRSLFREAVRWAATYFDAWISHPEWLIHELIADACHDQPRSAAVNYCRAVGCAGNMLTLRDELTGALVQVTADCVVNAGGAWLDRCASVLGGATPRVMGTKGSHLVLDHPPLRQALAERMAYFEAVDGRVCVVYPFLGRVLVGSTDIPVEDPDRIATEPQEVDYLLEVLRELFPALRFDRDQVVYTFVGVRPLARSDAEHPGQISRDHSVVIDPPDATRDIPVVGLVGGKWTTFRALAEEASDRVLGQLGRTRTASTCDLAIGGGADYPAGEAACSQMTQRIVGASGLSPGRASALVARYGSKAPALAQRLAASGDRPLAHAGSYSAAEIGYLCLETGVVHLDDLVIRRTLLAIRGQIDDAALAELADVAAEVLGWDAARRQQELHDCARRLRERHGVPLASVPPHADASAAFEASSLVP